MNGMIIPQRMRSMLLFLALSICLCRELAQVPGLGIFQCRGHCRRCRGCSYLSSVLSHTGLLPLYAGHGCCTPRTAVATPGALGAKGYAAQHGKRTTQIANMHAHKNKIKEA